MILTIVYFSACLVVAIYGRNCRIGFWGVLLFSVLLTPVMVFYGLLGLRPCRVVQRSTQEAKPEPETETNRWWKIKPLA